MNTVVITDEMLNELVAALTGNIVIILPVAIIIFAIIFGAIKVKEIIYHYQVESFLSWEQTKSEWVSPEDYNNGLGFTYYDNDGNEISEADFDLLGQQMDIEGARMQDEADALD